MDSQGNSSNSGSQQGGIGAAPTADAPTAWNPAWESFPYEEGEATRGSAAMSMLSSAALVSASGPQYGRMSPPGQTATLPGMMMDSAPMNYPMSQMKAHLDTMPAKTLPMSAPASFPTETKSAYPEFQKFGLPAPSTGEPTPLQKENAKADAQKGALSNLGSDKPWCAPQRPTNVQFYYRPTAMSFDSEQISLMDLVSRVFEFIDREFVTQVYNMQPEKGIVELAVFVRTTLVRVKLSFWEEGAAQAVEDEQEVAASNKYVLEVELCHGCCITFGEVYRSLKRTMGDAGADALSRTTTEELLGDQLSEAELGGDALKELGSEFEAPTAEEWDSLICDCEVQAGWNCEAQEIAWGVDSLCAVALGYEPSDLEPLAKAAAEVQLGLKHNDYCNSTEDCTTVKCARQAQLFAVSSLIKHLSQHPPCVQHAKSMAPALLEECQASIKEGVCWHVVLAELAGALVALLNACKAYNIKLSDTEKKACPTANLVVPVDAMLKEAPNMVKEGRVGSRAAIAQQNLDEAVGVWKELAN